MAHLQTKHIKFAGHRFAPSGGRRSDHTINLHGRVLRSLAGWLFREGYLLEHVLELFTPLKPESKEIVPLSVDEFRKLTGALSGPAIALPAPTNRAIYSGHPVPIYESGAGVKGRSGSGGLE